MDATQQKGLIVETKFCLECVSRNLEVFKPINPSSRCDFVVEINHKLYRIQCKSSTWAKDTEENAAFMFSTVHSTINHTSAKYFRYTEEEVDLFYTNFQDVSYLIPKVDVGDRTCFRIRLLPTMSNSKKSSHFSDDYLFETQLSKLTQN